MKFRSAALTMIDRVLCEPPLNIVLKAHRLRTGDFVPQGLAQINAPTVTARTFIRQHGRCLLAVEGYGRLSPAKCVLVRSRSVVAPYAKGT